MLIKPGTATAIEQKNSYKFHENKLQAKGERYY